MSIAPQSFLFNETAGGAKTGQTLPIGAQVSAQAVPSVPATDVANIEPAGAPITGASIPAGGVGLTGWLSAIWSKLSGTLAVSGTFWQATQPISGAASSFADGSDVTQGTKADSAYAGSGSASVIAALKGLYAALVAATPAGTNNIGFVSETYANFATTGPLSIGTGATLILAARAGRKEVTIIQEGTIAMRLSSNPSMTISNGILLGGNIGAGVTISGGAAIYGIVASGTGTVSAGEVY